MMSFSDCNDPSISDMMITDCLMTLGCFNNGGILLDGFCQTGVCDDNGEPCNESDLGDCADPSTATCEQALGCDEEPLVNADLGLDFDPPPSAGSPNACNTAIGTACMVVGSGESMCDAGTQDLTAETCP